VEGIIAGGVLRVRDLLQGQGGRVGPRQKGAVS